MHKEKNLSQELSLKNLPILFQDLENWAQFSLPDEYNWYKYIQHQIQVNFLKESNR